MAYGDAPAQYVLHYHPDVTWVRRAHTIVNIHRHQVQKTIDRMIAQDRANYQEGLAVKIESANETKAAWLAWKGIHQLMATAGKAHSKAKPGDQTPLPMLEGDDGKALATASQIADRKLQYFTSVSAGQVVTPEWTVEQYRTKETALEFDRQPELIPHLDRLAAVCATSKTGRAPGVNSFIAEFAKHAPEQVARLYGPLFAKITLVGREPLRAKGGIVHDLYKQKGEHRLLANWREILLANVDLKLYHRILRDELVPYMQASFLDTQCGGVRGKSTAMANHYVRTFMRVAKQEHQSVAVLFLDSSNALCGVASASSQ